MASTSSRLLWRRARDAKNREDRTVNEYIKIRHPEIYREAVGFYEKLDAKYPHKGDLRKLPEFYQLSTRIFKPKTKSMVLRIPLLSCDKSVQDTTVQEPAVIDQDTTVQEPAAMDQDTIDRIVEDTTVQEEPAAIDQDTTVQEPAAMDQDTIDRIVEDTTVQEEPAAIDQDTTVQEPAAFAELGAIDQDTIDQIVADLQNDPDIYNIFEYIEVDQLSPLETELLLY